MVRRSIVLLACLAASLSLAGSALGARWENYAYAGASPGVTKSTPTTYTDGFHWIRTVGNQSAYTWWVFTGGGTLKAGPVPTNDGLATWRNPNGYNNFYWKFRNDGSAVQGFDVYREVQ
jgi:hypothetical protein